MTALTAEQIHAGGIYTFRALPRSIFAPNEGVARVIRKEWTPSHGDVFHIQLRNEDGAWLHDDRAYGRVSLYDVEFFNISTMTQATAMELDRVPESWLVAQFPDFDYTEDAARIALNAYSAA